MTKLPDTAPGHWDTPEGREIAVDYLAKGRASLCMGDISDFHLANKQYLEDIHAGNATFQSAIGMQTAAKERIRWLSAHLAAALQKLAPPATGARIGISGLTGAELIDALRYWGGEMDRSASELLSAGQLNAGGGSATVAALMTEAAARLEKGNSGG